MLRLLQAASIAALLVGLGSSTAEAGPREEAIEAGKKAACERNPVAHGLAREAFRSAMALRHDQPTPPGFPRFDPPPSPAECAKFARQTPPPANGQTFTWVQRYQWMAVNDVFVPNLSAVVGGTDACSNMVTDSAVTAGGIDTLNRATRKACDSGFVAGGSVGMNFLSFPNPLETMGITQALGGTRDKSQAFIGGRFDFLYSNARSTFQGTPITNLGAFPSSDSYNVEDNWILGLTATLQLPVCQNVNFVAHGGYAWVNKTVNYHCNGTCDIAATPRSVFSQDVWVGGPTAGAGLDFVVPGLPFIVGFDYTHIFVGEKTFLFGNPAQVQIGFRVDQDVDLFTARATVPLGGMRHRELRWGPL